MFGLSKHGPDSRYGVVIDIGSSTVTTAIVLSEPSAALPVIVWSYKERVVHKESSSGSNLDKAIATATINAFLQLGSEGIAVLKQYDKNSVISDCNVAIGAPWSYTVTQTGEVKSDEHIKVTKSLIDQMSEEIDTAVVKKIGSESLFTQAGIRIINTENISFLLNGYRVSDPIGHYASNVTSVRVVTVMIDSLYQVVADAHTKILPASTLTTRSFIHQFYETVATLKPGLEQYCLVDIGGEAIELGVVRDGILEYVTHANHGHYSLARSYATATKGSFSDILDSLKHNHTNYKETLNKETQAEIESIFKVTVDAITDLFMHTGDSLSIPKTILLHTDSGFEILGTDIISKASTGATGLNHTITDVTAEIFAAKALNETKILLSGYFFHNKSKNRATKA